MKNIIEGLFVLGMGMFIGYMLQPTYPDPCWLTTSDVIIEGWYQEEREDLLFKMRTGSATQEDVDSYNETYSYPVSMRTCIGEKVFDESDILYYRKMTRKEMYEDWND